MNRVYFINQCVITYDDERKEWICQDELTNEGYRTTNIEIAKRWCWWSLDERKRHYSEMARALHDVAGGKHEELSR